MMVVLLMVAAAAPVVVAPASAVPVASAARTAGAAVLPAPFTGSVDDFYRVPDPLPPGVRGEVIRMQAIDAGADRTGWRIMYHSVDDAGRDRAVTGVITIPNASPPAGGWPLVAYAHGTTGVNAACAPSRGPSLPGDVGIDGVRVQTDYLGLGPVGELHPYIQRASESNALIDSVRAAHDIVGDGLSDDWFLIGGSQGGHAVLAANEDAVTELPDLNLLGTVALVPGAETTRTFGDRIQVQIIMALAVFGNSLERQDLSPADLLTPEAFAALEEIVTTKCLGEGIDAALPFAATDTMFKEDPEVNPVITAYRERNEVGRRRGASPVFVAGGTDDIIVVIDRVRALRESLCSIGQPLTYVEVPGGTHDTTGAAVADRVAAWLQARAGGEPLTSDCALDRPAPTTPGATTPAPTTSVPVGAPHPTPPAAAVPVVAGPRYTG